MGKQFIKAVLGGVCISLGGAAYLSVENHIAGAFLFSLGLLTIYTFGLSLYTGKLCYIPNRPLGFLPELGIVLLGNAAGTAAAGYLLQTTRLSALMGPARLLVERKLSDSLWSAFVLAAFCGLLMSIAVLGYATSRDGVGRHLVLVLPVMVFILCGFEHSVADLFYVSMAGMWSLRATLFLLVVALGNLLGGVLLPLSARLLDGKRLGCEEA